MEARLERFERLGMTEPEPTGETGLLGMRRSERGRLPYKPEDARSRAERQAGAGSQAGGEAAHSGQTQKAD
jgi:hypothetical protein